MNQSEEQEREIKELRERLSRLSEASLHINESLEYDAVLQGVLDSARSSGMTSEEARQLWELPDRMRLFDHLSSTREPLRLRDLLGHLRRRLRGTYWSTVCTDPSRLRCRMTVDFVGTAMHWDCMCAGRMGGGASSTLVRRATFALTTRSRLVPELPRLALRKSVSAVWRLKLALAPRSRALRNWKRNFGVCAASSYRQFARTP